MRGARTKPLSLFEGYGIELEYMLVRRETLEILPRADAILKRVAGRYVNEVAVGDTAWSNELVNHVIELKTNGPVPSLHGLDTLFTGDIRRINTLLGEFDGMLLPTAMHPLMNPARDTHIWSHGGRRIYRKYHNLFNCHAHGWANLQSSHINLPFGNDGEFGRLHAAIRLVLPLIPALAAASPIFEGRATGLYDTRLEVYRTNQKRVPVIVGDVIPEPVFTRREYKAKILGPIYEAIAPLDPEAILRREWLNSRGAIARFQRNAIEIRTVDMQECPRADVAVAAAVAAVIRALVEERFLPYAEQCAFPTQTLKEVHLRLIAQAGDAVIDTGPFLKTFAYPEPSCRAAELWEYLLERAERFTPELREYLPTLEVILRRGCLAKRILHALDGDSSTEGILAVYRTLATCLEENRLFAT